ncbi:MAG: cold-shock protein [Actinomycetota bacterium]|nr:cold-shock protein [Actinomycetota bacterium]
MKGTVTAFDERRGLGTITGADGNEYPFHSTRIADGSRVVALNAAVTFEPVAGHLGRFEATAITPRTG